MPLTSIPAETMFARLKRKYAASGRVRHDILAGTALVHRDRPDLWLKAKVGEKRRMAIYRLARKQ